MQACVSYRVPATRMTLLALVGLVAAAIMILLQAGPAEAAFPGTNGKIAFSRDHEVYTMNPDGSGVSRITDNWYGNYSPAFSAGGQKIAYVRYGDTSSEIYTMNSDGSGQTRITDMPGGKSTPAWSPDGEKIAYSRYTRSGDADIYISNSDGTGEPLRLTYRDDRDTSPAWSPDGTRLAWNRGSDIRVVRVDSSGRPVADSTKLVSGYAPSWSPDGEWIAYTRAGDYSQIRVINVNDRTSRGLTRLYSGSGGYRSPAWSPDGEKIAYTFASDLSSGAICVVTPEGAAQGCLTDGSTRDGDPDWQPINFSSPPAAVPFCSVSDCVEPTISNLTLAPESSTRDRTPTIRATVSDDRTNLAKSNIKLFVDGRRKTTFSYDRSTDRLRYTSGKLSYGWHTVRIEAKDAYNNSATETWRFRVVR